MLKKITNSSKVYFVSTWVYHVLCHSGLFMYCRCVIVNMSLTCRGASAETPPCCLPPGSSSSLMCAHFPQRSQITVIPLSAAPLLLALTFIFPLLQSTSVTFLHAADELWRDRLHVLIGAVGPGGCNPLGPLTVVLQPVQVQLRQLFEESVPLLFTQLRPELQDVRLPRAR